MDATMEDDCGIQAVVPAKKKKMKQARLPFQMLSTVDSPNSSSNKKRKLTSPLVECKSPKVVKITTKENSIEDKNEEEIVDNKNSLSDNDDNTEIVKDTHVNGTQEKVHEEMSSSKITPKRHSAGKGKRGEKMTPLSASSLTKFLKQSKESENTEDDEQVSVDSMNSKEDLAKASDQEKSLQLTSKSVNATRSKEKVTKPENISDTDIKVLSSDDEDKEEKQITDTDAKESVTVDSPETLQDDRSSEIKHKRRTPKQLKNKLGKTRKTAKKSKVSENNEKSNIKTLESNRKLIGTKRKSKETVMEPIDKLDTDIEVLSSDNESKGEEQIADSDVKEGVKVESPRTPKHDRSIDTKFKKITPKQLEKNLGKTKKIVKQSKTSDDDEKSNIKVKKTDEDSVKSLHQKESLESNRKSIDTKRKSEEVVMDPEDKSDSDIVILSSENESDEEEQFASADEQESINTASPKTPKTPKTPMLDKSIDNKLKKLTPKQQEKKLESARKKEEREKLRMEKDKKLEEERENKRREREEKKREKEEKEQIEKEQKLKEKEQKLLKKQMEIEQKQKEKEAKEEERRKKEEAKEEEKKRKEEEKLEAERKKQKAASTFASFFVAKKQENKPTEDENVIQAKNFMPFEVKADMKIAPVLRRMLSDDEKCELDEKLHGTSLEKSRLYLTEIKNKKLVPRTCGKTWPFEVKDDLIVIDEDNEVECNVVEQPVAVEKHRPKLLQFSENRRPPYWGTWRKRSASIKPCRPFSTDKKWFNYEVDSDEEWEEEEEGESLRGSDDEKDEENPESNEYDVDNEFMVPHGYLSDEEVRADEEDKEDMSPETQKFKLKVLGDQFECERNEKTLKLKPKIIGCIWQGSSDEFSENISPKMVDFLTARKAWVFQNPVILPSISEHQSVASGENSTPTKSSTVTTSRKTKVPKEALPDLIRLVHGNVHGKGFLVKEFMAYWNRKHEVGENQLSKASLAQKIRDVGKWMACPEEGPLHLKACWYVPEKIRKQYLPEDEELTLPNRWSYILTPKRRREVLDVPDKTDKEDKAKEKDREANKEKKTVPLITQFTKKITQEEMKKQLTVARSDSSSTLSAKPSQEKAPKRATLISIGRGEQFSKSSRENLLKNFISSDKSGDTSKSGQNNASGEDDVQLVELDKPITMDVDVIEETEENSNKPDTVLSVDNEGDKRDSSFSTEDKSSKKMTDTFTKPTESSNGTSETPMEIDEIRIDD